MTRTYRKHAYLRTIVYYSVKIIYSHLLLMMPLRIYVFASLLRLSGYDRRTRQILKSNNFWTG